MNTLLLTTLVKAGVVNEMQIVEADTYDYSSSVTEKLLTLGYGSEDDVFKIIKNKLQFPVVEDEAFVNINPEVLSIIPKKLMEKHHVLPFAEDDGAIHVAMVDPTFEACTKELNISTGKIILPYGASISRLSSAINKYFGIGLYETFKYGTSNIKKKSKPIPSKVQRPKGFKLPPLPGAPLPDTSMQSKTVPAASLPENVNKKLQAMEFNFDKLSKMFENEKVNNGQETQNPKKATVAAASTLNVSMNDDDLVPDFNDISSSEIDFDKFKQNELCEEETECYYETSAEMIEPIYIATSKEELLLNSVEEMKKISSRGIIFIVSDNYLLGIAGYGKDIEDDAVGYRITLTVPSIFKTCYKMKSRYTSTYDKITRDVTTTEFFSHFGKRTPANVVLSPLVMNDEVFAMLYLENTSDMLRVDSISVSMIKAFENLLSE